MAVIFFFCKVLCDFQNLHSLHSYRDSLLCRNLKHPLLIYYNIYYSSSEKKLMTSYFLIAFLKFLSDIPNILVASFLVLDILRFDLCKSWTLIDQVQGGLAHRTPLLLEKYHDIQIHNDNYKIKKFFRRNKHSRLRQN